MRIYNNWFIKHLLIRLCLIHLHFSFYYSNIVSKQVHYFFHKVIIIRVFFIFNSHVESFLKDQHYICSISCTNEIERNTKIFYKFVFSLCCTLINIYFIGDYDAWYFWTLLSHFFIPSLQILIGDFSACIKY